MDKKVESLLKKYPYIVEDIQKKQAELNDYAAMQRETRETVLKSSSCNGMPHGYDTSDPTYQAIEKIMDRYQAKIDELVKEINELMDLQIWMDKAFFTLTVDERRIIYLRYERGASIEKIPYILKWKCGRTKVFQIMDEAKEKIRRIML